jgi:hypothetical protein
MKRMLFLFLACATAGFITTSCSKDDDNNPTAGDLVGKWEFSQEGDLVNGNESLSLYEHQAGCSKDFIQFFANGTAAFTFFYSDDIVNCEEDIEPLIWTKNGNIITATGFDGTQSLEIMILNESTLKVKFTEEGETYITVFTKVTN